MITYSYTQGKSIRIGMNEMTVNDSEMCEMKKTKIGQYW